MQSVTCVLIGDQAVGKTSLLLRYRARALPEEYTPTVFDTFTTNILVDEEPTKLQVRDTAGKDHDRLRLLSYSETDVFVICFSLVEPMSFFNAWANWYAEVRFYCPNTPIVIVGTKRDLRENIEKIEGKRPPVISHSQAERMAEHRRSVQYLECSALKHEGIDIVFDKAVRAALEWKKPQQEGVGLCFIV